jgi:hypothetical protein
MNRLIPLGLILFSAQAFALDSFSVMRSLGNKGEQGKETLLLICTKDDCNLSFAQNGETISEKKLKRSEIKNTFKQASAAFERKPASKEKPSVVTYSLEYQGKENETSYSNPDLSSIEVDLQARLRK